MSLFFNADVLPSGRGGKQHLFRIHVPNEKSLDVAIDSESEMRSWIEQIRSCTDAADSRVCLHHVTSRGFCWNILVSFRSAQTTSGSAPWKLHENSPILSSTVALFPSTSKKVLFGIENVKCCPKLPWHVFSSGLQLVRGTRAICVPSLRRKSTNIRTRNTAKNLLCSTGKTVLAFTLNPVSFILFSWKYQQVVLLQEPVKSSVSWWSPY